MKDAADRDYTHLFKNPDAGQNWFIRFRANGKKIVKSTGTPDERQARRFLLEEMGKAGFQRANYIGPAENRIKFADLRELIERDYRIKRKRSLGRLKIRPDGRQEYVGALSVRFKHLEPFFRNFRMADVTVAVIEAYRDQRLAEFRMVGPKQVNGKRVDQIQKFTSRGSVDLEMACLKRMFRLAYEQGKLSKVPPFPSPLLRPNENAREGFLDKATFIAVRDQMPEDLRDPLTFLYLTGWRPNEMRSLEWRSVDFSMLNIDLRRALSKNGQPRDFPLDDPELLALMLRAKARMHPKCAYVFYRAIETEGGSTLRKPLTSTMFRKRWRAAAKRVGIEGMLIYDMRRSAVRNRRLSGVSDSVNMRLSGHKTRLVFDRYDITSRDDLREAVLKQRAFLDAQPNERKVIPIESARGAQLEFNAADAGRKARPGQ